MTPYGQGFLLGVAVTLGFVGLVMASALMEGAVRRYEERRGRW